MSMTDLLWCATLIGLFDATGKLDVVAAMERYPAFGEGVIVCSEFNFIPRRQIWCG